MKKMNKETMRNEFAGRTYYCPWRDYKSSNFWSVYGHAIKCGYRHGLFDVPLWMIKTGFRLR